MINKPIHILLAEDDEDDALFFKEALRLLALNTKLSVVGNGKEAVDYFSQNQPVPDFVFLDINMPKLNGIETLKAIKSLHPSSDFHIIMLSTSMSDFMVEQSYRSGARLYIQKPTQFKHLSCYLAYCLTKLPYKAVETEFVLSQHSELTAISPGTPSQL